MCRTPKGPVGRYCNLPARSLGYYRQSGFLFCPPQLKDLLGLLASLAPMTASGRYGSFLLTSLSVRPSVPDPPDYPTFFARRRAVSSIRSFISSGSTFTISLFMLRNQRQRRGRKGRVEKNYYSGKNPCFKKLFVYNEVVILKRPGQTLKVLPHPYSSRSKKQIIRS